MGKFITIILKQIAIFRELKSNTAASDTCSTSSSGATSTWKSTKNLPRKNGKIKNKLFSNFVKKKKSKRKLHV